jgi:acid phosphatase type 7
MTRILLSSVVSLLLTVAVSPAQSGGSAGVFSRQPYLQLATPTTVTVVWRTRTPMTPEVRVGLKAGAAVVTVPAEKMTVRRLAADGGSSAGAKVLHSAPAGTWQYEATVSGLKPDTKYVYEILDGGKVVTPADGSCVLRTNPEPGEARPFSFWVVGDSGTGSDSQKAVHNSFKAWRAKGKRDVDFYVHVGDMAYNFGRDAEFQFGFFEVYADTLRGLTCWPAMGNHEGNTSNGSTGVGPYYDAYVTPAKGEAGGLASGTEAYYSWDYGRTHFVCLDSHDLPRKADGAMAQWLKADLEKTKADWVIAYWHHPPYTKGSHDSDKEKDLVEVREHLLPIIEAGGVDLVLTGHSHVYERSFLLNGAYGTPTVAANGVLDDGTGDPFKGGPYHKMPGLVANSGTVQIVAGHGGQALSRKEHPSPVMWKTITEWGSVLVNVNGRTLTAMMLDADGKERDTVQIVKDAKAVPAKIAVPKAPGVPEGPLKMKSRVVVPGAAVVPDKP